MIDHEPPEEAQAFAAWFSERGWRYYREWLPEVEDEDTGEVYPSGWQATLRREEAREDGTVWMSMMTVPDGLVGFERAWPHLLAVATRAWEQFRIEQLAASNGGASG